MFDLKGKVAVVTGASSGIGAAAARAYVEHGAHVALLARGKERLEKLASELSLLGDTQVIHICCDVIKEQEVKATIEHIISKLGHIDILLNNAGIAIRGGVHELSEEDWDKSMNVNVKALFFTSKYIVPHMMKQNYGKIVNISSVNAKIADKSDYFIRHSYNTSKSAVLGLSLSMAVSYGKYGITVNSIGPGLFETNMTKDTLFKSDEFLTTYNSQNPMGRPGAMGEVNGTILYLSSDASSYVTGQYIIVDGGFSLV